MCCFSAPVDAVSRTRIFARSSEKGRQYLAYEMHFSAKQDLAMILPIPVPAKPADDAVRFVSLKDYRAFFDALDSMFPKPRSLGLEPKPAAPEAAVASAPLPVVEVGDFEASFVPSVPEFSRLDARFRLPEGTWDKLPAYRSYGFAVFKLKPGTRRAHPMAFEFPRANPDRLFFPTVHIHDGTVQEKAEFDHELYCQSAEGEALGLQVWDESPGLPANFVLVDKTQGLVAADRHVYRHVVKGERKNEDVIV